ncbi:alpha/beta fold hydrolase [Sphingosinicella terrae]|uniref:alpha/beta fold hydrolase n=1 Tax=Sphingosinicella terrae TaxID=2172047 RepID=UPI000E0CF43E|nr:alpha/beta hydrolase [Sphingosinicella terrae]
MTGVPVHHLRTTVAGVDIFYREAGQADAPAVLLPHGYPCSSFEFRNCMARLGDRWRLLAPDFPGSGYSATPPGFAYDFDGFAELLAAFLDGLGVDRVVLYLHDFGGWIGLRLAMRDPGRIAGLIVQNSDIYEDAMGPKYAGLRDIWKLEREQGIARLRELVTGDHFRDEFLNHVRSDLAERIPPDLWTLHWSLMTDRRRENAARIIYDLRANLAWFPRYQAWLREHEPPALILWGPQDGYMPEEAGRAWLRDLPEAELHMLDGGHWLLETCLEEAVALTKDFLGRKHPPD